MYPDNIKLESEVVNKTVKKTRADADHLRQILAEIGMTQKGFADQLGVDERTVRRYVSGSYPVPKYVLLAAQAVQGSA
jgi:hypothetical protein